MLVTNLKRQQKRGENVTTETTPQHHPKKTKETLKTHTQTLVLHAQTHVDVATKTGCSAIFIFLFSWKNLAQHNFQGLVHQTARRGNFSSCSQWKEKHRFPHHVAMLMYRLTMQHLATGNLLRTQSGHPHAHTRTHTHKHLCAQKSNRYLDMLMLPASQKTTHDKTSKGWCIRQPVAIISHPVVSGRRSTAFLIIWHCQHQAWSLHDAYNTSRRLANLTTRPLQLHLQNSQAT